MTGIINNSLLLHLVGCLYYLYQWCTVKQIYNKSRPSSGALDCGLQLVV